MANTEIVFQSWITIHCKKSHFPVVLENVIKLSDGLQLSY